MDTSERQEPAVAKIRGAAPGPPVVLIHGFAGNNAIWPSRLIAALSDRHVCVAIALPSHAPANREPGGGDGSIDAQGVTEAMAGEIARRCAGPAILVGHSSGGWLALRIAASRPELVAGVVSVSGFASGRLRGILGALQSLACRGEIARGAASALIWLAARQPAALWMVYRTLVSGKGAGTARDLVRVTRAQLRGQDRRALLSWLAMLHGDNSAPLLSAIRVPTLLVHGRADSAVSVSQAQMIQSRIPSPCRLVELAGVGHFPFLEAAEDFETRLAAWRDEHFGAPPAPAGPR